MLLSPYPFGFRSVVRLGVFCLERRPPPVAIQSVRFTAHHKLFYILSNAARKKTQTQTDPDHWSFRKLYRSAVSWFTRGLRRLKRCLQNSLPLPPFHVVMKN